jgi:hypothetical protein
MQPEERRRIKAHIRRNLEGVHACNRSHFGVARVSGSGFVLSWYPRALHALGYSGNPNPNPLGLLIAALIAPPSAAGGANRRPCEGDGPGAHHLTVVCDFAIPVGRSPQPRSGRRSASRCDQSRSHGATSDRFRRASSGAGEELRGEGFLQPMLQCRMTAERPLRRRRAYLARAVMGTELRGSGACLSRERAVAAAIALAWLFNASWQRSAPDAPARDREHSRRRLSAAPRLNHAVQAPTPPSGQHSPALIPLTQDAGAPATLPAASRRASANSPKRRRRQRIKIRVSGIDGLNVARDDFYVGGSLAARSFDDGVPVRGRLNVATDTWMKRRDLRFVIIPKCAHPWADEVHRGAMAQASLLSEQLGIVVVVDYLAPAFAGVDEQNSALERAAATQPDGIAVDPVALIEDLSSIRGIRQRACRSFSSTRRLRNRE